MRFSAGLPLLALLSSLLAACSGGAVDAPPAVAIEQDSPGVEIVRTITVTGGTQCALSVRKDRDEPVVHSATSCELKIRPSSKYRSSPAARCPTRIRS